MAEKPLERTSCLGLCDTILDKINKIEDQIDHVLTAEPDEDTSVSVETSPMRDKLAVILGKLNILSSRINI